MIIEGWGAYRIKCSPLVAEVTGSLKQAVFLSWVGGNEIAFSKMQATALQCISHLRCSWSEAQGKIVVEACSTALLPLCHDFYGERTSGKIKKSVSAVFSSFFQICNLLLSFSSSASPSLAHLTRGCSSCCGVLNTFLFLSVMSYQLMYSITSVRVSSVMARNTNSVCQPCF